MKQLRPYQTDLVLRASKSLSINKRSIIHAPTGAGKSLIATEIKNRAVKKGNTVLILSESIQIFSQLKKDLNGIEINSKVKDISIKSGRCYVAMIQTLKRRPLILNQLKELGTSLIVLIDECHISISRDLIEGLPDAFIGGLTATPFGRIHKHLPELYNDLVEGPQVDFLIQEGFLCSYKHIARSGAKLDLLEMRNGEYSESSQNAVFTSSSLYDGLKEDLKVIPFNKCVVFVASIKQATALNEDLQANGFKSCTYHSDLEHGAFELAKFTELNICNIIVTIKSLSKGWDYPPVDLVVLMHKTSSPSLYLQEVGRGSRVIPGVKTNFIVLDYGENWLQHGLYWDDRPWGDLWKETKKSRAGQGVAPVAMCPECEAIMSTSQMTCPFCGNIRPKTEHELQEGELLEVTQGYTKMIGRNISSLSPEELCNYAKLKNKKQFAIRVAKALEQTQPGYLSQFGSAMGYKRMWLDMTLHQIDTNPIQFTDITLR